MRKVILNSQLLDVLALLKRRQDLAVSEQILKLDDGRGWANTLREYYYGLPEALTTELGLMRNECCIRAIERLQIPNEWLETNSDQLHQFEFCY